MVEIGMTPLQALQAATVNAARWMKLDRTFGALSPGMAADIVILEANPLTNIRNSRSVAAVVQQGVYFDAKALAQLRALVGE